MMYGRWKCGSRATTDGKTKRSKKEMTELNHTENLKKRRNQIKTTQNITEMIIMNEC